MEPDRQILLSRIHHESHEAKKVVFKVSNHVQITIASLISDGRILSRYMRFECVHYSFIYESPFSVSRLVIPFDNKV